MQTAEDCQMLISSISHEIRNPVTLIGSYLQLIASQHPEIRGYPYWDIIEFEMKHLQTLLNDLSAWQNGLKLCLRPIKPAEWFAAYREAMLPMVLKDSLASFTCQTETPLPTIHADADKLRQVMDNLIRNALEASPERGPSIHLRVYAEADVLCISLCDDGPGIPPHQMEHIFEPFVSFKKDGTGLGLAICRRIVEAHGGTISCSSPPGGKTEFLIRLPQENRR
ncbi:MAG: HAMP domain-containing sensor histidine kinase [Eubacteriales bacterium]|nr:HAMP domain-containing sensor histidine kinase [Eubacteriales bacterium]